MTLRVLFLLVLLYVLLLFGGQQAKSSDERASRSTSLFASFARANLLPRCCTSAL